VVFTKWGGFGDIWQMVSREFPHTWIDGGGTALVEYDCGIDF
jgi:hypothetical protein